MGPLRMDAPVLAGQKEVIYISSERMQDVVWKICREREMIVTDEERKSQGSPDCRRDSMMTCYQEETIISTSWYHSFNI